tara:strand:+ start:572 stop:1348 length:777 start_codon:yes stop_codon:yes gene_type:complete
MSLKVTIITVTYNAASTIEQTIKSVLDQDYNIIEYIIIDGLSTDNTIQVANKYKSRISKIVSEKDKGIYDAMNKGIELATGDIIGILNADDYFTKKNIISNVVNTFHKNSKLDGVYSNLLYINKKNKISRLWETGNYKKKYLSYGWTIPHPTLFVKKAVYLKCMNYDLKFENAADYEFILRILVKFNIKLQYINIYSVIMRTGGASDSGLFNMLHQNKLILKAMKKYNVFGSVIKFIVYKIISRLFQIIRSVLYVKNF